MRGCVAGVPSEVVWVEVEENNHGPQGGGRRKAEEGEGDRRGRDKDREREERRGGRAACSVNMDAAIQNKAQDQEGAIAPSPQTVLVEEEEALTFSHLRPLSCISR